ncbi:Hypothetical protein PHPALM_9037 [Phytophthora palmivora]|uniref:Uncharacterized protein n=1 Tax=Phytophthora palmivora TaxID=4796 RepID=A0A2P4Y8C0_9STRA|nr:Hypothetical protein PHPALM_9037 [Phytophthora palmivora]
MSDHGHDGSQHGSGRPDPPSPRSEIGGPTGGTPEDLRRSLVALRRRVLRLSDDLRLTTRRADEVADRNCEHVCSLESLEMMCYRAEVHRRREERDTLQSSLESDRIIGLEPSSSAPEISALEAQIVDLNRDLDRRSDEIRHLQAHIDDLARDRHNLESTIHHLASEMTQAGGEILDLQQANRDLDRSREEDESTLSATEESLRRTRSSSDRVEAGCSYPDLTALIASLRVLISSLSRPIPNPLVQLKLISTESFGIATPYGIRAGSASDKARLQTLEGDITRARQDVEVARKAYADRECTITENQAQIRTLSRDLGKVKKQTVPVEAEDESMEEENESEFDLGGGSTGGRSPSPDQASIPPSKDVGSSQPSGEVIEVRSGSDEEEEEENAEVADDLYETQTLMAISQSRSEARRRDHASPQCHLAGGSGGSPSGSDGSNSDAGSGDPGNGSGPTGGSGPANPPPGRQPHRITFVPQVPFPEGRCVPGRRIARVKVAADIDPWIESRLANQTLIAMTVNFLFPILPFRPDWIFPHRPTIFTCPTAPAFCGHLITEANVKALQAAEPWQVIRNTLPPISFEADVGGRLGIFVRQYRDFEAVELIAYWEPTHKFPITAAMITQSPWLCAFAKQRNNRRSHAGNRWKRMLLTLIQAMIEGWCDLDLLLDPFFLHFPKRTDEVVGYTGIEARHANLADPQLNRREPTDLLEALAVADTADPWSNHFRDHTTDHPARQLPQLDRKFFGLQVAQPPASS